MNELAIRENRQETKKMRNDTRLSKEVASAIARKIEETGVLCPNFRENPTIELYLRDDDGEEIPFPTLIPFNTYNTWLHRNMRVPETGELLATIVQRARDAWDLKEEKRQRKALIETAKKGLKELQTLPRMKDGKTTKTKKRTAVDSIGRISHSEETETIEETGTFIESNRLRFDGYKFLLERLDPDFMPKQHDRHDVAILTLADLRRYQREQNGEL